MKKRLAQGWSPTSAVFMLGDYGNCHVALYTTESHSLPCQNVKLISCLHVYIHGFQMPIKHPTYGRQACDQEAALQRIFQVALTMPYFVPSCAKHRPLRKWIHAPWKPSIGLTTPYLLVNTQHVTYDCRCSSKFHSPPSKPTSYKSERHITSAPACACMRLV